MPRWMAWSLLVLFLVHLVPFTWLTVKRRQARYGLVALVFLLLSISFGLVLFAPGFTVGHVPAYWYTRVAAWACALLSLILAVRRRLLAKRAAMRDEAARRVLSA
ncbi:MAG: hypothetical protein IT371_16375 [Deltaproteobacteria bacterium]|nr:hypothetical protein [Deltaproteobacteria bacterium]